MGVVAPRYSHLLFFSFASKYRETSSFGYLLEHLESSGTKIIMRGPVVCQLYAWKVTQKQTNKLLVMNFMFFSNLNFFVLPICYVGDIFKALFVVFLLLILAEAII